MAKTALNTYTPDYLVPPGEVLADYLDAYGMTRPELADRTGLPAEVIHHLIEGKTPITPEIALKLECALGRPAHFWNNLEQQYQKDWLKRVPVQEMLKRQWISGKDDWASTLKEVLCFFGVNSPQQWFIVWQHHQVAFRQTQRFETYAESVSAWLRKGEIDAQQIRCEPFDKERFQNTLEGIRRLTREEPTVFQPQLIEGCAAAGVAVVFVPELPKSGVCGATRWLGDKAVIQLSLRYKSNDHLWFTFFHEAGHIIEHGRGTVFIEGRGLDGTQEEEANQFARDLLIPPTAWHHFLESGQYSNLAIQHFADEIGIAPGIVVGRLQHDKLLKNWQGNKLKVFYCWSSE